ncbi:DUF1109 domain-containing protein [Dyella flava]|uniref:DUF1109 domain-containing protein n=1 Tax=Dyella flava TaxID=1920170 RepID=A0ABS2JZN1_9GAMM|nr:DUF1109 domain-containing protein [Dyella flava]MBM7124462.1 DUF1109 domain-containing protein [Dyella flava]GLQ51876.1 hypothetical protein GCM10010872_33250 [Dyella flava]
MNTDTLVSLLATDIAPVRGDAVKRYLTASLLLAYVCASIFALVGYGLRPDMAVMLVTPLFWLKLALPLSVATGAYLMLERLVRPGQAVGSKWNGIAVPILAVWLAAAIVLWEAPPDLRASLLMGKTWRTCPFNIALLSAPCLFAVLFAVRQLAPTRRSTAGAVAGLLAGALGTLAYCLHCPEMGVPFWATWYLLGMAIPTATGALLGRHVLRW